MALGLLNPGVKSFLGTQILTGASAGNVHAAVPCATGAPILAGNSLIWANSSG